MSRLVSAKALAEEWAWQAEHAKQEAAIATCFDHVGPLGLIAMWESGKKLSDFEFQALVERWLAVFGDWPPFDEDDGSTEQPAPTTPEPELQDDTMLPPKEVVRLLGISLSTLKRMMADGRFPQPLRPSARRIGWPAREVKALLDQLDGARQKARR